MQNAPDFSRVSIRQHAASPNTDQLYDPLRQTFLKPQNLQRHSQLTPIATRSSFVSNQYKILSPEELQRMEQNIYIPNTQLQPTNRIQLVKNQRFVAVDASERIIGPPITPQELQNIRLQGVKKQEVVYEFKRQQVPITRVNSKYVVNKETVTNTKLNAPLAPLPLQQTQIQQQISYQYQPKAERYTVQNFDDYGKNNQKYNYNLFSMIDQPANNCRQFGVQGCTSCPGNDIVAPRNRPLNLSQSYN